MNDLYQVLGVPRDADQATIRKAFRKLARQHHPDVNKAAGAEARFKEINAAYQVLSDEEKRSLYDEFGEDSLRQGFNAEAAKAWRTASRSTGGRSAGFRGGIDIEELLNGIFQQTEVRGGMDRRRGPNLELTTHVDFLTAARGGEVHLSVRRPGRCTKCAGEGGTGRQTCKACKGTGQAQLRRFGLTSVALCEECAGTGSVFAEECQECAGSGRVTQTSRIKVRLPAGVDDGQTVRLQGQGGEGSGGATSGDLLLNVRVEPHPWLKRAGLDLEMEIPISIGEAVCGASITLPTLQGEVKVKVPPGAGTGTRLRLKGKGIVLPTGAAGDLYLILRPTVPANPSPALAELAQEMDRVSAAVPREDLRL